MAKASSNKPQKISYDEAKKRSWWPLFLFLFFLIVLISGFVLYKFWQKQNYYSSISSFVFTSSTGPVAPPYQVTKTMTLTSSGCTYTVAASDGTVSNDCSLTTSDFNNLIKLYYSGDLGTKISYNNNAKNKTLLGGPQKSFTVNFADGSSSSTLFTGDFIINTKEFFAQVSNDVVQFKQLNF